MYWYIYLPDTTSLRDKIIGYILGKDPTIEFDTVFSTHEKKIGYTIELTTDEKQTLDNIMAAHDYIYDRLEIV